MAASEEKYPESFYCALTLKVMKDPVIDPEGHTYERAAIEEWLARSQTSPMTRSPLTSSDLIPNRALREVIEAAKAVSGSPAPGSSSAAAASSSGASPPGSTVEGKSGTAAGISLASCAHRNAKSGLVELLASVQPPAGGKRTPVDMCCVIDVSGSMSRNASVQNASGEVEEFDIELLDVVKHSVRTVINMLEAGDRLSLVSFSSAAKTCLASTAMTTAGRKRAEQAVNKMSANGATNLWEGLRTGLESFKTSKPDRQRVRCLLLLTDGCPNVEPPRGHLPTLERYLASNPDLDVSINTFGFGYTLDSELLSQLATMGSGSYSFIPDSGFVGTIFVNFLANTLSTVCTSLKVQIESLNGASLQRVVGDTLVSSAEPTRAVVEDSRVSSAEPTSTTTAGSSATTSTSTTAGSSATTSTSTTTGSITTVTLGSCQYSQTRDCLVQLSLPEDFNPALPVANVRATFRPLRSLSEVTIVSQCYLQDPADPSRAAVDTQRLRLELSECIRAAMALNPVTRANHDCHVDTSRLADSRALLRDFLAREGEFGRGKIAQAFFADLKGQVTQALSRDDWYTRWGQHYLPSLVGAHLSQQCNNFKDPGIQVYGEGKLFKLLQDEADDLFAKIPPPSRKIESMAVFNDARGGCFAGDCLVRMSNGEHRPVCRLRKGDSVYTPTGPATVLCVVQTSLPCAGLTKMCALEGGLLLTPWHPIAAAGGEWVFPNQVAPVVPVQLESVFTFVLSAGHILLINGVQCVTLGHGFSGDVREHPFLGTRRVVESLSKLPGWTEGIVHLTPSSFIRETVEGKTLINDIRISP